MDPKEIKKEINKSIQDYHMKRGVVETSAYDLYDFINISVNVPSATITTTGSIDAYFIVPQVSQTATIGEVNFSGAVALATSDINYITWTITNLGQAGAGSAVILGTETTKVTGGSAIAANTKRTFSLTTAAIDLNVATGDRLIIRAAMTGTLANTVTFPVYLIQLTQ